MRLRSQDGREQEIRGLHLGGHHANRRQSIAKDAAQRLRRSVPLGDARSHGLQFGKAKKTESTN